MKSSGWLSAIIHGPVGILPAVEAAVAQRGWSSARMLPLRFQLGELLKIEAITVYIAAPDDAARADIGQAIKALMAEFPMAELMGVADVEDGQWELAWQAYFRPILIGRQLRVRPPWEADTAPDGRFDLTIRPGMGFGTGSHATTQLLLEFLDIFPPAGHRVLDYGCGSGILAIAALKLGASSALLVDIDQDALDESAHNVAINGVAAAVEGLHGVVPNGGRMFDLILANITEPVLAAAMPLLQPRLAPTGQLWASGILGCQLSTFLDAVRQAHLVPLFITQYGEWVAAILGRN